MKQKKSTIRFLRKAAKTTEKRAPRSSSSQKNEKKHKKKVRFSEDAKESMKIPESDPSSNQEELETYPSNKKSKKANQSRK